MPRPFEPDLGNASVGSVYMLLMHFMHVSASRYPDEDSDSFLFNFTIWRLPMLIGRQFSFYPMTDQFIEVILAAVKELHERNDLRVETDDLSTLLIGVPEPLFEALETCFVKAATTSSHLVLSATFSRGCPGEPDDPICHPAPPDETAAGQEIVFTAREPVGIEVSAQFALYPLGISSYMEVIYREIQRTKATGVFGRSKHFCTRLEGDVHHVFAALRTAFEQAANDAGHVVVTATISKGSPTQA